MTDEPEDTSRIADLEAKVAALEALVKRLSVPGERSSTVSARAVDEPTSRRNMLRGAALVAGGVVAGAVSSTAHPVAAADGDSVRIGYLTSTTAGAPVAQPKLTQLNSDHAGTASAFLFQASQGAPLWANTSPLFPGAVWAATSNSTKPTGLYAWSGVSNGIGVVARAIGASAVGLMATGTRAQIALDPSGNSDPRNSAFAHVVGDVVMDDTGQLWLCVVAGTPGSFRKLAGPTTAGAFHPIPQVRIVDTRMTQPAQGAISGPGNKVFSVADSRDLNTGAVIAPNVVPPGATAVTGNVTVTQTGGAGFATVMPGDAPSPGGSSVNWSNLGATVANGFVAKLDGSRQLKVFVDGVDAFAHVIVDINGYYL